ncbi:sodium/hydrogen exchanger 1-like isoform X2 [Argentina anserina]|uniref:sodium/hydrogen exchanger 1-like isoform X2 n=1 Tax=Argentina anserina TaxID=57926 RepID=UPI0021764C09|nr:sodium/hydrogen exchanger 1-like isoform X2 [Potentilla anserina]
MCLYTCLYTSPFIQVSGEKKQFFINFITILMFGAIGTLISCSIIAFGATQIFKKLNVGSLDIGDYLAIGAIFAATDSVCTLQVLNQDETPLLYSLVFGEVVVNDATSVVLFNAIQSFDLTHIDSGIAWQFMGSFLYLFFASTMLGVFAGLLSAFIIKKLYFARHSTDREVALMMLMPFIYTGCAILFECHSHCVLLWDCYVPLHLAQCDKEFKSHDQACFCDLVICLGDFYLPLCWYGCLGHRQVEICK